MMFLITVAVLLIFLAAKHDDWNKRKAAIYLRRSKGESGTTKDQLRRIQPIIDMLIDEKKIAPSVFIVDEGRSESGFDIDRPMFREMMDMVDAGEVDIILAESLDRIARDALVLGDNAGRQLLKGLELYSINDDTMFSYDDLDSKMMGTILMEVGGRAKKGEIQKAEIALRGRKKKIAAGTIKDITGTSSEKGHMASPEMDWYRILRGELDMRQALTLLLNLPRHPKGHYLAGRPKDGPELTRMLGLAQGWHKNWFDRAKDMEEMGVLDDWFDVIEAMTEYLLTLGKSAGPIMKRAEKQQLLYSTRAWRRYPMGVNLANTLTFVEWPNPLDIGIEALAVSSDARKLKGWDVKTSQLNRTQIGNLLLNQTQPRAGE